MSIPTPTPGASDLFAQIKALADARTKAKNSKGTVLAKSTRKAAQSEKSRLLAEIEQAAQRARQAVSHLHATAVVLPRLVCTCTACGSQFHFPGGDPLVRFRSDRDASWVQERAEHPSLLNPQLPRVIREIHSTVGICENCYNPGPVVETQGMDGQLDLRLELPQGTPTPIQQLPKQEI